METLDLEYFRRILTQSLNDLINKSDETVCFFLDSTAEISDFIDQANLKTDRCFRLRMRDRENQLIRKIEHSLCLMVTGRQSTYPIGLQEKKEV